MMDTIFDLFQSAAASYPDRPLLWYEDETITYREAESEIDRRAALLSQQGWDSGDRLGLLMPNDPEFVFLFLAAAKLGITFVPVNYRQEAAVLKYLLSDASLSGLVVDADVGERFSAVADDVEVGTVFGHEDIGGTSQGIQEDLDTALKDVDASTAPQADVAPDDVAVLNYTSGTTGPPKGVLNPHRAFVRSGRRLVRTCRTGTTDRALLVLPLFHANPITYGLIHMIAAGGSIAPVRSFSASEFWSTAREAEATFTTHVGSVLEILQRSAESIENVDTPISFALGGAAGFDDQAEFEDRFDIQIVRLYGLSEVGAGLVTVCEFDSTADNHPDHQGSVIEAPFIVRILSEDGLGFVEPRQRGEIVIRPDEPATMFKGYLGKEAETLDDWQDLWMHTGDLGTIDEDGNLRFVGRMSTSIRRYGENVSPWEVESPLRDSDVIAESAAVGVPDEVAGEEIMLYVVPTGDKSDPAAIHEHLRDSLPDHLLPRYLNVVDSIPKTSTQKIARTELRERGTENAWDSQ